METPKVYILVNMDMKMSPGQMCAQVGHACSYYIIGSIYNETAYFNEWLQTGEIKIILKSGTVEMKKLLEKYKKTYQIIPVRDSIIPQIHDGLLSAILFEPLYYENIPIELRSMNQMF